jgi:hypothetical protein
VPVTLVPLPTHVPPFIVADKLNAGSAEQYGLFVALITGTGSGVTTIVFEVVSEHSPNS